MKIKDKSLMIIVCSIGFCVLVGTINHFWPIISLVGRYSKLKLQDGMIADESQYIGQTIVVQPIAKLGKLKNFSHGPRGKYHYLLTDNTSYLKDPNKLPYDEVDITEPTRFTVIEQRYDNFGSNYLFCVFRSDSGLTFAEECSAIKKIDQISEFLMKLRAELDQKKSAYVGLFLFDQAKDAVFKVNNVQVVKVNNEEELIENFDNDTYNIPLPISMLDNEKMFLASKKLHESEFYKWNYLKSTSDLQESAESIFEQNKISEEILKLIQNLEPNSLNNRWVLTQIYILAKQRFLDEGNYQCLRKKYLGVITDFEMNFQQLKQASVSHQIDYSFTKSNPIGCERLKPPSGTPEVEIIEGLI